MTIEDREQRPAAGEPLHVERPGVRAGSSAADRIGAILREASRTAGRLLRDPVGGLAEAHALIARDRVLGISIVFAIVAAIGLALAGGLIIRALLGGIATRYGAGFGFDFAAFLRSMLVHLVTILGAAGGVLMLARTSAGAVSGASALFIAAASFLPLGLAALTASIIAAILPNRFGMFVASLLMLFGACYLVLVLNAGLRRIAMIDERRAAFATAGALAVALIVGSIIGWMF